jgi:hypothetical protein
MLKQEALPKKFFLHSELWQHLVAKKKKLNGTVADNTGSIHLIQAHFSI